VLPGKARYLPYPLDRAVVLENEVPDETIPGQPTWPEDSDERIFVKMEVSLNEYVQLASAIDAGRDPAYPDQSAYIWWLWNRVIHAMNFCEEMAQCLIDQNEALINALADAIANNETLQAAVAAAVTAAGGGVPGEALTPEQASEDITPENVRDEFDECIPDALWGGMLYLVQSGNRVITDFFEVLEVATNTLENMEIVSRAIPAAGDYIATAAAFADQLAESLQEGYAGAYTESYEQSLACDLFCAARTGCELTPEMIMAIINARLTAPLDIGDFGELMVGVATGTWIGDEIADVMFLVYFGALVFGQQFLSTIGIRPLTVIISLGADQLASDNWIALCDCPECGITGTITIGTEGMDGDIVSAATALVARLDITGTAYGRRIEYEFDEPVTEISLGWNTEGALDDMFAQLAGNATQTLTAPSGSTTLIFSTPGTTFIVDLGYAGDSGAYASNPARINIVDACT